jgi:alpha,alpha-trehalase
MKLNRWLYLFLSLLFFVKAGAQLTPTPEQLWGALFTDVQLKRALGDNKTFVDAIPKHAPNVIMQAYNKLAKKDSATLHAFISSHFILPQQASSKASDSRPPLYQHLQQQWNSLLRKADKQNVYSSLLPLPYPYVVPGGRFREIYYWDSYFTMLGLAASNRYDLIEHMLDNFAFLINQYGHIPNGNRNYYLSRSQPPYFALMVQLLQKKKGNRAYKKFLPAMEKEYRFWMDSGRHIKPGETYRRVVKLADGTVMNRYYDDSTIPRQESYYEDVQTGLIYQHKDGAVYKHLRAAAESGWDFSSRWLTETFQLSSIQTTNIIPVDLNCLLYAYEQILSSAYASQKQVAKSKKYKQLALQRKRAIITYCWNNEQQYFFDYDFKQASTTGKYSLAGMMPLFVNIATTEQAHAVKARIEKSFVKDGGVVTTLYHTGQQWDAPNGWPPLQYITIKGLMNYRYTTLADTIATRWMKLNEAVYITTGKMLEKYNVENIHLPGGGGEYPTQDGFGWTNGVYLELHRLFKKR